MTEILLTAGCLSGREAGRQAEHGDVPLLAVFARIKERRAAELSLKLVLLVSPSLQPSFSVSCFLSLPSLALSCFSFFPPLFIPSSLPLSLSLSLSLSLFPFLFSSSFQALGETFLTPTRQCLSLIGTGSRRGCSACFQNQDRFQTGGTTPKAAGEPSQSHNLSL